MLDTLVVRSTTAPARSTWNAAHEPPLPRRDGRQHRHLRRERHRLLRPVRRGRPRVGRLRRRRVRPQAAGRARHRAGLVRHGRRRGRQRAGGRDRRGDDEDRAARARREPAAGLGRGRRGAGRPRRPLRAARVQVGRPRRDARRLRLARPAGRVGREGARPHDRLEPDRPLRRARGRHLHAPRPTSSSGGSSPTSRRAGWSARRSSSATRSPVAVDISVELVAEHNYPPETVRQRAADAVARPARVRERRLRAAALPVEGLRGGRGDRRRRSPRR